MQTTPVFRHVVFGGVKKSKGTKFQTTTNHSERTTKQIHLSVQSSPCKIYLKKFILFLDFM